LALYLLTFIVAFARRPLVPHRAAARVLPLTVLLVVVALLSEATEPAWLLLALHLLGLGVIALACHGDLARDRPEPRHLTAFYLWLVLGGVLGGLFNTLAAPLLFSGLAEYPIVLVLAALLVAARAAPAPAPTAVPASLRRRDLLLPLGLGLFTVGLVLAAQAL